MDWRCNAARAASSSRTSSGTPRIVNCTDMKALCHLCVHFECRQSFSSSAESAGGIKAVKHGLVGGIGFVEAAAGFAG